jgi:enoyl-CoA hydratase
MLYTGREVTADQARDWALVTDIADDVLTHSLTIAHQIAQAGPIALRLTKTGIEQSAAGLDASIQWEALAQPVTMTTADLHEGIAAFRENRTPKFSGR